jgi:hypothetical protein
MEQNNGFVRIGMEGPVAANVVARSGLLISSDKPEPARIYRLKNEKVIVHYLD